MSRRIPLLSIALVGVLCAACAAPPSSAAPSMRVLVRFQTDVIGDDAGLVRALERETGAAVAYETSVAADRHVYRLACPADDDGCARSLARIGAMPGVAAVTPDVLRSHR
jgi:hypothetical protein